jgi:hypothetical protein
MNSITVLGYLLFFALGAADILFLGRRLDAKVRVGTMTRTAADQKKRYQWRLFIWAAVISVVGGISYLFNLH